MTGEEIVARLLYRDGLMLVIDKPAGFAVHRGPKGGESLEDYFDALRFGLPRAPALAHRLDRDTSGCLVLGRHRKALAALGHLFKSGRVGKTYWAVVVGGPMQSEGRIDVPLGRKDAMRGWWMKHDPAGQPAVTTWKVMGRSAAIPEQDLTAADAAPSRRPPIPPPGAEERADRPRGERIEPQHYLTWLALEPLTGRTHQLRVHCAEMGWPIVGDTIYGDAPREGGGRLHLHAREVVVPLYQNRAPIRVTAPVPPHMHTALRAFGWTAD